MYQPQYGEAEYGEAEYGEGEYGQGEYREAEYGEAEYGEGEFGRGWGRRRGRRWRDSGDDEYAGPHGRGEQQFLPLLPIIGNVLGGLLKEAEAESSGEYGEGEYGEYGEYGEGEYGEAQFGEGEYGESEEAEQFLGGIFKGILGGELEQGGPALNPAHEAELASRLLEVSSEAELEYFLGDVVNVVGRAARGIRDFAVSPAGQAVVQAVKPLAKAALPWVGGAIGSAIAPGIGTAAGRALGTAASSLFEMELGEMSGEQAEYELARRVVQLTSSAARTAALAPPVAPPQEQGQLAVWRASRRFAPGFYRRGVFGIRPYIGRRFGAYRRYGGYGGYGRPYRRYYGGRVARPYRRYYGGSYYGPAGSDVGPPEPPGGPPPDSGPPPPGFRWVAVPIGAPLPGAPPGIASPMPEPAPPAGPGPGPTGPDPSAPPPPQSEMSGMMGVDGGGQWVRRGHKIIVYGA
jgi:uncharacterized protein (DUF697 family)